MAALRCWIESAFIVFVFCLPDRVSAAHFDQASFQRAAPALRIPGHRKELAAVDNGTEYWQARSPSPPWGPLVQLIDRPAPLKEIKDVLPDAIADIRGQALLTLYVAAFLLVVPAMVAITLTYLRPPALMKDAFLRRYYGYLFFEHQNKTFAANFEISLRGSIGVLILAIPFLDPTYKDLVKSGYYTSTAPMLFVFTLYKTVGETLNFAFEGILGTFLAVLNMWTLLGIFPQGVYESSPDHVWWCAVVEGVLFVLIIVGMDLDNGCKMFALNWHCYFWMDFLNPNAGGIYSSGWTIDITGPAISGLVQSCIGVGVAVVATLLPFPRFALDKARDISLELSEDLAEAWDSGIICFTSQKKDRECETKFRHDIKSLVGNVDSMAGYASVAWWECLGLPGRPQRVRDFLCQLGDTITESYDRLKSLQHLCQERRRGEDRQVLMQHMRPCLEKLSKNTGDLLKTCVSCAIDGTFDDDENAKMAVLKNEVLLSMKSLSDAYRFKKAEIEADQFLEAAFCLTYCSYARLTLDFEAALRQNVEHGMFFDNVKAWAQQFRISVISDSTERNCWIRSSAAILLCFAVGYVGYSAILPGYNAVPAAVVSLLLSKGLTSQATKNLERFEGVVLGTVFGQIAYALLGWCSLFGYIAIGLFLVIWTLPTLFLYYGTEEFSLRGCLLAAFGVVGVLRGCSNEVFEAAGSYNTVVGVVVAITIKVAVDSALARSRASTESMNMLTSAWDQLQASMTDVFSPEVDVISFKHVAIKDTFKCAAGLSGDAQHEPRLWWCAWKHELFTDTCQNGVKICEALSDLEAVFSKTGRSGAEKSSLLRSIQHLESCRKVNDDLVVHIAGVRELCNEAFSYHKDGYFASEYKGSKALDYETLRKRFVDLSRVLSQELAMLVSAGEDEANLEYDIHCNISVFIVSVECMLNLMEEIHTALLSQ